jgi:glutathione S-transferase
MMQTRYRDEVGWGAWSNLLRPMFLANAAGDERAAEAALEGLRKTVLGQMSGHGMGRHTDAEIHALGIQDLTAVSDYLGGKPFFFGATPTGTDATVYGYLANLLEVPLDSPPTRFARGRGNLVDHCARMRERFFSAVPRG